MVSASPLLHHSAVCRSHAESSRRVGWPAHAANRTHSIAKGDPKPRCVVHTRAGHRGLAQQLRSSHDDAGELYEVLGLRRRASKDDIKKAFRQAQRR